MWTLPCRSQKSLRAMPRGRFQDCFWRNKFYTLNNLVYSATKYETILGQIRFRVNKSILNLNCLRFFFSVAKIAFLSWAVQVEYLWKFHLNDQQIKSRDERSQLHAKQNQPRNRTQKRLLSAVSCSRGHGGGTLNGTTAVPCIWPKRNTVKLAELDFDF